MNQGIIGPDLVGVPMDLLGASLADGCTVWVGQKCVLFLTFWDGSVAFTLGLASLCNLVLALAPPIEEKVWVLLGL